MFSSELRAAMGKDVPEDVKSRVLSQHEDNVQLREQLKTTQEKLVKARAVSILPSVSYMEDVCSDRCTCSSSSHRTSFSKKSKRS